MATSKVAQRVQKTATHALRSASNKLQTVARDVEQRDRAAATHFYRASCWLKTAAAIGGAL